jgi:hypothetical protein
MHYQNMEFRLNNLKIILVFISFFILTGCSTGFTSLLNPSEYDRWREDEMKREIKDFDKAIGESNKFDDWAKQKTASLEYLVGSTKQDIKENFGKPTRIERNRKFSYKGRAFVAEEVWTYRIKDTADQYTNYDIALAFENEIVVGVIVF